MSVQEYIEKHKLSLRIEEAVNAAVRSRVEDPVHFISSYLNRSTPSIITQFFARQILDDLGCPAVEVQIQTSDGSFNAACQFKSQSETNRNESSHTSNVTLVINHLNEKISPLLIGRNPTDQKEIDHMLTSHHNQPENSDNCPKLVIFTISFVLCKAAASSLGVSLSRYFSQLGDNKKRKLPLPILPLITNLKASDDKNENTFQEIYILPVGGKNVWDIFSIYQKMQSEIESLMKKEFDESIIHASGREIQILETKDIFAVLELTNQAIQKLNLKDSVFIGLKMRQYDAHTKNPQDLLIKQKSCEDIIQDYKNMCSNYNVAYIECAFPRNDTDCARRFFSLQICNKIVECDYKFVSKLLNIHDKENSCFNVIILKIEHFCTISELIEVMNGIKSMEWDLEFSIKDLFPITNFDCIQLIVDLCIGLSIPMIKLDGRGNPTIFHILNQLSRMEYEVDKFDP